MASTLGPQLFGINIGNRQTLHSALEPIYGNVVMANSKAELVGRVRLDLSGRTKTKIIRKHGNSRSVYRGRHHLFTKSIIVHAESTPLEAGHTYAWPFLISFPEQLPGPSDGASGRVDSTLPPTYYHDNIGLGTSHESFVEYMLTATLFKHQSNIALYTTECPVKYSPTMPPEAPLPDPGDRAAANTFECKSLLLLPENKGRDLTFKEKTSSFFNSSKLPMWKFAVNVTFPTRIALGTQFLINFGIEHLPQRSTAPQAPEVELVSLYVSLKAVSIIQAEGMFSDHTDDSEDTLFKKVWDNVGYFNKGEGWTKILRGTFPMNVPPTFSTYNIRRSYCLKVAAVLKCADKTFNFTNTRSALLVLPRRAPSKLEAPPIQPAGSSSNDAGHEDALVELPTYQEALSEPPPPDVSKTAPKATVGPSELS
jgi:hypothetical protein